MNKKGFTLLELLVVVLIIGILAAIALPQYRKVVAKAQLQKGVSLVESLYQAQQAYYLVNGKFATDIDNLDITVPTDSSCTKTQEYGVSKYKCDFGVIGFFDSTTNVQFQTKDGTLGYLHFLKDKNLSSTNFEAGHRYCFADSALAGKVCEDLGKNKLADQISGWNFGVYEL